jgi:hypothetical protein
MLSIIKKWLGIESKTQTSGIAQPKAELAKSTSELVTNRVVETPTPPTTEKAKKATKPRKAPAPKAKAKTRKAKDN